MYFLARRKRGKFCAEIIPTDCSVNLSKYGGGLGWLSDSSVFVAPWQMRGSRFLFALLAEVLLHFRGTNKMKKPQASLSH